MPKYRRRFGSNLKPPFLKRVWQEPDNERREEYPWNLPFLAGGDFALEFDHPLTVLVGENGTGKSTLLEAIAAHAGFPAGSGTRDHNYANGADGSAAGLARDLRFSWLPKISHGFFFRAESFFNMASYIDQVGNLSFWGGRKVHTRSHGEMFLATCLYRMYSARPRLLILDEPEAALSPARQLEFLRHIDVWLAQGNVQIVMATHSPLLMSHPETDLRQIDAAGLRRVEIEATSHFRIARDFYADPHAAAREALRQPLQYAATMREADGMNFGEDDQEDMYRTDGG